MTEAGSERLLIIGGGASGVTAARHLRAAGIPFDLIEREDDVGGNWYYGTEGSSVYSSTHLISSKPLTEYPDYPMPAPYPDYPKHTQVLAYLRDYARHFGIYDHADFKTEVVSADKVNGGWAVTVRQLETDEQEVRHYAGLIVANGHLWHPKCPTYPGTFTGETMHAKAYKHPDLLRGKRVLVVGGGNSGCDIAVEAAQHADAAFHSLRRGYHFIPKYLLGKPADQAAEDLIRLGVPLRVRRALSNVLMSIVRGDPTTLGLPKPDHKLFESHPTINSQLMYYLGHGDLSAKPDVTSLEGRTVTFADGSEEVIDLIIYATGYRVSFPFLDEALLPWQGGTPALDLNVFHPNDDNLFFVGLIQPDSGMFWLCDLQAQLIAKHLRAQRGGAVGLAAHTLAHVTPEDVRGKRRFVESERHALEVDHFVYAKTLRRLLETIPAFVPAPPASAPLQTQVTT